MSEKPVAVRMFSALREGRAEKGLPVELTIDVGIEGRSALDIATDLGLDTTIIEGVFVNHVVRGLDHHVMPGDRIAFVPHGTPGPHRFLLGLYEQGHDEDR